jgi:hypothetical protein
MSDFENNKILDHLRELEEQLEAVNQKFHQIELELRSSGQSLEKVYVSHKNRLDLADQKRVNENLFHQLERMQKEFSNIQSGITWFSMQMAVFMATLERAAFFVVSERERLEAKKREEKDLEEEAKFHQLQAEKKWEEQRRIEQMAEKARTYPYPTPFHLTPYRTWPY